MWLCVRGKTEKVKEREMQMRDRDRGEIEERQTDRD